MCSGVGRAGYGYGIIACARGGLKRKYWCMRGDMCGIGHHVEFGRSGLPNGWLVRVSVCSHSTARDGK